MSSTFNRSPDRIHHDVPAKSPLLRVGRSVSDRQRAVRMGRVHEIALDSSRHCPCGADGRVRVGCGHPLRQSVHCG